eukprot:512176-Amphidinium_carterae.2
MPLPVNTPAARFPTLEELRGPSSSSLPTTNRVSHSGYSWNENPYSWNESHSGGSGPVPLAASARPMTVPQSSSHSGPTLADLRKVKTTLPVLQLKGDVPFNLIKTWKEWTLAVQAQVTAVPGDAGPCQVLRPVRVAEPALVRSGSADECSQGKEPSHGFKTCRRVGRVQLVRDQGGTCAWTPVQVCCEFFDKTSDVRTAKPWSGASTAFQELNTKANEEVEAAKKGTVVRNLASEFEQFKGPLNDKKEEAAKRARKALEDNREKATKKRRALVSDGVVLPEPEVPKVEEPAGEQ